MIENITIIIILDIYGAKPYREKNERKNEHVLE